MDKIWKFDGSMTKITPEEIKICFKSRLSNIIWILKTTLFSEE
jgi:hypothetical protein